MNNLALHAQGMEAGLDLVAGYVADFPRQDAALAGWLKRATEGLTSLSDAALAPYDLHESDFRGLMRVFSAAGGHIFPGDLATYLAQTPANVTRITNVLVKRGLVARTHSTEDRRRVELTITPAGRQFVRKLLPKLFPPLRKAFACLSAKDKRELQRLLQQLVQSLDAVIDP